MSLAYLFRAEFFDGSVIEQTQEDRSMLVEGKSQFYDVLQRESDLARFSLVNSEGGAVSVDLTTGTFTFLGESLPYHDPSAGELDEVLHSRGLVPFRLIYFRRVYQTRTVGPEGVVDSTTTHFFIGWRLTHSGVCYKQTLRLV